jgi:hypothetical protein
MKFGAYREAAEHQQQPYEVASAEERTPLRLGVAAGGASGARGEGQITAPAADGVPLRYLNSHVQTHRCIFVVELKCDGT